MPDFNVEKRLIILLLRAVPKSNMPIELPPCILDECIHGNLFLLRQLPEIAGYELALFNKEWIVAAY